MDDIIKIIKEIVFLFVKIFTASKAGRQLEKVREIYGQMTNVVENTPVERFLILRASNGGGVIKPGVHLNASLIYEMYRSPIKSNMERYQGILLDSSYVNILVQIIQKNSIAFTTDTLEDHSILKSVYLAEKIKYCELYYLGHNKKAIYYCSISTTDDIERFSNYKDRLTITLAINKIRNLLK